MESARGARLVADMSCGIGEMDALRPSPRFAPSPALSI
jgi:hypothetical protein